jgi:hypothetical protein
MKSTPLHLVEMGIKGATRFCVPIIGNGQTSGVRHVLANHRVLTYPSVHHIRLGKYQLLMNICFATDVEKTYGIPLRTQYHNDAWAWHYERLGILLMRYVYCLLVSTKKRRLASE